MKKVKYNGPLLLLGSALIIWPIAWAAFNKGINIPHKYVVIGSLLLGSLALAFAPFLNKASLQKSNITQSVLGIITMFIFWMIAGSFVLYIGSLILYVQLGD